MAIEPISNGIHQTVTAAPKVETAIAKENTVNIKLNPVEASTSSTELDENRSRGKEASENHIKSAISQANSKIREHRTRCEFSYHEATKRVTIKVMDRDTEEVIREIPPEETLEMVEKMWELAGLLVDERR